MMMTKVSKSHEISVRFLIYFSLRTRKVYGEHVDSFRSFMSVQGRNKFSILIDNWNEVFGEQKIKYELIF